MQDPTTGHSEGDRLPKTYAEFRDHWRHRRDAVQQAYGEGRHSWLLSTLPPDALELSVPETIGILSARHGRVIDAALAAEHCDPLLPVRELPASLRGPLADPAATPSGDGAFAPDAHRHAGGDGAAATGWIRRANVVGINVRTVGSFFGVVKYLLTLPSFYNAVHLLPIWEPGVVGSLYGMSSWEINPEFFDPSLAEELPHLDTAARQLRAVTNLIHATGRSIGMDVIPHTDRFSEIAIAQPSLFEWIRREDTDIVDKRADLHEEVQERILDYVDANGPAVEGLSPAGQSGRRRDGGRSGSGGQTPGDTDQTGISPRDLFFGPELGEETRNRILFGEPDDPEGRSRRRGEIVHFIHAYGYEPAPATMAPPYRGLEVDLENRSVDSEGDVWRDYRISRPESMSRVFGPLARYKLYERLDDNRDWQIDFSRPRTAVWDYVCDHYAAVQERFGFDFMRGDMSHVQMRADGVPVGIDHHYDIHSAVKRRIQGLAGDGAWDGARHFAYFAETFMAPRGVMAYGDEIDHLDAADAEVTLGDLQSKPVNSDEWLQRLRRYWDVAESRYVTPSFTVMTGDKDDPRFDGFYLAGSELRTFLSLFLVNMPSYTALGFELRDIHTEPAPNEYYTKLYVFQEREGPKATRGPYRFGRNGHLFHNITRIRLFAEELFGGSLRAPRPGSRSRPDSSHPAGTELAATRGTRGTEADGAAAGGNGHPTVPDATPRQSLRDGRVRWLRAPDPTGGDRFLAWTVDWVDWTDGSVGAGEEERSRRDSSGDGAVPAAPHSGSNDDPSKGRLLFLANTDTENPVDNFNVPWFGDLPMPELLFTTHPESATPGSGTGASAEATRRGVKIHRLEAGECRVYRMGVKP